jgi:molybdopterin converting factor subunit 1
MRVNVLLFARLRELASRRELPVEVNAPATIGDVWNALVGEHPALAPHASSVSCARNAQYARMATPVQEGDEVVFLPPVSGG